MRFWVALFAAMTLNAVANLMMRVGALRMSKQPLVLDQGVQAAWESILRQWVLILGLFCFASNVIFYTYALSGIRISMAYPIMVGGGFAIIAVIASRYLGESLAPIQWVGVALILAGVTLVAREMKVSA